MLVRLLKVFVAHIFYDIFYLSFSISSLQLRHGSEREMGKFYSMVNKNFALFH